MVQRGGARVYELVYGGDESGYDYGSGDLTALVPELCEVGIVDIAVQRQPDTRVHCVLANGTVAILVFDADEKIKCWVTYETNGLVERVVVLPGAGIEDAVYYVVNRFTTTRRFEKWAMESECRGGSLSKCLDAHAVISQASSTTITGLTRLNGQTVSVWANGKDLGSYAVSGGSITVSEAVTSAIVGLTYEATYKSTKLAYGAGDGTALCMRKRVPYLGLILADTHYQGLEFGPDFTTMDNLPARENESTVAANYVWEHYDKDVVPFPGEWDTDSRVCLRATAPKPCTVLAMVVGVETNERKYTPPRKSNGDSA